jgi:hypothetical protein
MRKLLYLVFLGLILLAHNAKADEPFKPDTTPNCKQEIKKGAQKSLNDFAALHYQIELDNYRKLQMEILEKEKVEEMKPLIRSNIQYPKLVGSFKINLKFDIESKAQEIISFAAKKYKCDLELDYPQLPENYRF